MGLPFLKMHGAGNDFVVLDLRTSQAALTPTLIAAMADRRRGIGCDQLIVIAPAEGGADATMQIHNADGTPAEACGNATRCVAWLLAEETGSQHITLQTEAGLLEAHIQPNAQITVDMGAPRLGWRDIPLATEMDTLHLGLPGDPAAVSMGNPHITLFVEHLSDHDIATQGPALEHHHLFPERVNAGFAQITGPASLRLKVWERGAGLTLACGSGACAALVNAHRRGLLPREATIEADGGTLHIAWREHDGHVLMTGPAVTAFKGEIDLAAFPR